MKVTRLAGDTAELALRIADAIPHYLPMLTAAQQGQPGAQNYDAGHGSGTDTDPTGDTAVVRDGDRAYRDKQQIVTELFVVKRHLEKIEHILVSYGPGSAVVINDRAGIGPCHGCNRYCDGKENRLTRYKGTDDLLCDRCRKRRDRADEVSNVSTAT